MRRNFSTHSPSEIRVGYSRAVQVGKTLYVSGTTSIDDKGKPIGSSLYEQTIFIFRKIESVLTRADFSLEDIAMVTAYVVDMKQLNQFDRAFKEFFGDIHPCCTLVGINTLVAPNLLIEISFIVQKE